MDDGPRPGPRYVTTDEAALILGMKPVTLAKMRGRGEGPRYRNHGRLVRYSVPDLVAWSDAHVAAPVRRAPARRNRPARKKKTPTRPVRRRGTR